ncbi:hypothetical protein AB0M48_11025 [Lentzea sp. NPDC051208]|uniref:pPIWI_RE_Y domain-containing protein n=1 Tax=Lentzea sp. NPDC051208 TaxID=3154642 RepID=UPI0034139342
MESPVDGLSFFAAPAARITLSSEEALREGHERPKLSGVLSNFCGVRSTGYRTGSASSRGTAERDSEVLLALVASGLVRMQAWKGVPDRARPYNRNLQLALDRMAARCAVDGRGDAPAHVGELVWEWAAKRPLNLWPLTFPAEAQVGGEKLLIDGEPTEFCHEWAVEAADVVGEVHESALIAQVRLVASGHGRPEVYAEWRKFVTENSVVTPLQMLTMKNKFVDVPQWANLLDESYEEVPPEATVAGRIGVCGACRQWITPSTSGNWRCTTWRCVRSQAGSNPDLVSAQGLLRLRRELVRSVALPGLPELKLAHALAGRGAQVVLYPEFDSLDLFALWPCGFSVAVDVKDWLKPYLLARRIKRFPVWAEPHRYAYKKAALVVPADRTRANSAYCQIVRTHSDALRAQPHIAVLTDEQLIAQCPDTGEQGVVTCGP